MLTLLIVDLPNESSHSGRSNELVEQYREVAPIAPVRHMRELIGRCHATPQFE